MSKNIWDDLLTEERNLVIPRELMLKRKELGLNDQEYILLLDYLYCLNQGETEDLNQWLSELNRVSEATIERRLNSVKKKGLLRQEVRTDENGRIKGMIFNPEPLAKKLKSLISNNECKRKIRTVCESNTDCGSQNEAREKNWKDDFCSTRWYNDVFSDMYEEAAGHSRCSQGERSLNRPRFTSGGSGSSTRISMQKLYLSGRLRVRAICSIRSLGEGCSAGFISRPIYVCWRIEHRRLIASSDVLKRFTDNKSQ
jgi:predicted transcriptional regulator